MDKRDTKKTVGGVTPGDRRRWYRPKILFWTALCAWTWSCGDMAAGARTARQRILIICDALIRKPKVHHLASAAVTDLIEQIITQAGTRAAAAPGDA
jgi:hypothetical protein